MSSDRDRGSDSLLSGFILHPPTGRNVFYHYFTLYGYLWVVINRCSISITTVVLIVIFIPMIIIDCHRYISCLLMWVVILFTIHIIGNDFSEGFLFIYFIFVINHQYPLHFRKKMSTTKYLFRKEQTHFTKCLTLTVME